MKASAACQSNFSAVDLKILGFHPSDDDDLVFSASSQVKMLQSQGFEAFNYKDQILPGSGWYRSSIRLYHAKGMEIWNRAKI